MSERTKNQLKQASSILLITDFQDFTEYIFFLFFFFFSLFFFLLWGTNPYRAEQMDELYIGAVHYCKTHVNPPSQILFDVVSTDFSPLRGGLFGPCLR